MSMKIIRPGLVSTIQDAGRYGYQAFGFAPGGALDRLSMRKANALVGNDPCEAVIEMMLMGITAEFDAPAVIAVTGANMNPKINGERVETGAALHIAAGDTFEMSGSTAGLCAYLAVAGGFAIERVMGSRSTGMRFNVGGYKGRKLAAGDEIAFRMRITDLPDFDERKIPMPKITREVTLRAIPGCQDDMFSASELEAFFGRTYTVTNAIDRMGIRLDGTPIVPIDGCDIVSDGTAFGAVQVPTGGQPIILMADRQTTGGYAKIATVITADIPKAAQMMPGSSVIFEKTDIEEAQRLLYAQETRLEREYHRLNG